MMRRRCAAQVSHLAAVDGSLYTLARLQSSRGNDGSRLHTFISDNRDPASASPASGAGGGPRRSGGNNSSSNNGRRGGQGSAGGAYPNSSNYRSGAGAAFVPPTATPLSDWATQLQRELMSPADPLGGLGHKDYYRDPATGYSPQYAPRDFVHGGRLAYPHTQPGNSQAHTAAAARREWLSHDVASMAEAAQQARETARHLRSPAEREAFAQRHVPADRFQSSLPSNESLHAMDQLHASGALSDAKVRQQATLDRYQAAAAGAGARTSNNSNSNTNMTPDVSYTTGSGLNSEELLTTLHEGRAAANDDVLDERLRIEHGLRAKERFDFNVMQRSARVPFQGYDMDRFVAQRAGRPQGAQQLPPTIPPSSMEEALKNVRGGATLPDVEAQARLTYAANTTTEEPKLGEALTRDVVRNIHTQRESAQEARTQARKQRFGLGRQGALVQDGGPDRRTVKKHVNDERLVDAAKFSTHAYRRTATDEHVDPYVRRNTERGVGHLLRNRFDIQRREDRVAHGQQDLTERSTTHYGVPIQQSVDNFVLTHRNARGDRPLDYFKPFPDFRAQRLYRMYRDVEGFSLMKQRPEVYEWELFTRYRAHHQQRRELALLHGLEPVANETAEERAARRLALDELCEKTPFDPSRMQLHDDEMHIDVETLRNWFGVYVLPSPTVVEAVVREKDSALNLYLHHTQDEMNTLDKREHVLSSRYLSRLLLFEGFQHRWNRGFTHEVAGKAPEPTIKYAQSPDVLQYFDAEEQAMYQQYVKEETQAQLDTWSKLTRGRRYIAEKQQYGEVVGQGTKVAVVDVQHLETGSVLTVSAETYSKALERREKTDSASGEDGSSASSSAVRIDGQPYALLPGSERGVIPLSIRLESGEAMELTDETFSSYPLEVPASAAHNHALNYGIGEYSYNRGSYVETQDTIWEEATAEQVEGWSPATHADGLRPGLPVRARRQLISVSGDSSSAGVAAQSGGGGESVSGDFQRGRIVDYARQPFFNPDPRLVTVAFHADGAVQQVPLSDVLVWQRRYHGPERTVGDESRRYNPAGLRRYIDVADPNNEKAKQRGGAAADADGEDHFLEKYERRLPDNALNSKYRTTKQISEIDQWNRFDTTRAENYRPLSISHRRDYIRQGYMHRYTPWEWIAIQEADQPLIHETIRHDNVGASYFFSLNRAWRYKARPHGYLRNYENEVRDLLQFVDGVTPWKQAQKIRTYWEVRQHHPMPQFNRPEVAMHRNTAGLLPSHMWETDKKTGKVKGVKDSVRDYQTKTPLPKWVQL